MILEHAPTFWIFLNMLMDRGRSYQHNYVLRCEGEMYLKLQKVKLTAETIIISLFTCQKKLATSTTLSILSGTIWKLFNN